MSCAGDGHSRRPIHEIKIVFKQLNTLYTFLICRKHVVPAFETLEGPISRALGRPLAVMDLAMVVALMPRDCLFKYIDVHQLSEYGTDSMGNRGGRTGQKESEIYTQLAAKTEEGSHDTGDNQVLFFEFIDGNMKPTMSGGFKKVQLPQYSVDEMRKMITARSTRFHEKLRKFVDSSIKRGLDPDEELLRVAKPYVPQRKDYEDPVQAMLDRNPVNTNECQIDNMDDMITRLKSSKDYIDQMQHDFLIPPKEAEYGDLDFHLVPEILNALEHDKFYSHQAEAINAIHNGEHVIITTSTSSGKSLIYQISAIDRLIKDPNSTFMYVFPTKALAQDQKRAFIDLISKIDLLKDLIVDTYDGDTEPHDRKFIRANARVIFTNPDMIHTSILPGHPNWRRFLYNLKFVVIDELHVYKGLFGSHVALIMRRLQRLCNCFYENMHLQFVSCSATLREPVDHMRRIFNIEDVRHVSIDGSPRGAKHLIVWNPPRLSLHMKKHENFIQESAKILVQLILSNVRTIAFCYVRRVCELLMKEVRNILQEMNKQDLINEVMSYRGGYSVSDRRKIEREMFHGNLRAVISTNALELGIDIGSLDVVLMCGFPLSISNFHQQSGRAGRRNHDSMTIVVASDSPVDQHYVAHPEPLLDIDNLDSYQDLVLDFDNALILEGHIQCAAFEIPIIIERDIAYFEERYLIKFCSERLHENKDGYHTNNRFLPWPSKLVAIRGVEEDMYAVVDITNNRNVVIEEVEASRTNFTLYDGGIFIHQGFPYLVKEFNPAEKYAKVQRVDVDWVTSQRDYTDVDPQEIEYIRSLTNSDVPIYFGKTRTTMVVFGFFRLDKYKRIIDAVETHNPPVTIESKGLWIDIPKNVVQIFEKKQLNLAGGIHAAQHAVMGLLPRYIVTDVHEIQTECKAPEKEFAETQTRRIRPARIIFYDSKGGKYGSGLSIKIFEHIDDILHVTLQRVLECPCDDGCPNCVASASCKESNYVLSKPGCLIILYIILGYSESEFIDKIKEGPEANMPEIKVETVAPVYEHVKFAEDFKIVNTNENTVINAPKSETA